MPILPSIQAKPIIVARSRSPAIRFFSEFRFASREAHGNNDWLFLTNRKANDANTPSKMLLKVAEQLNLNAPPQDVWKLLRDTPRLAALLPGVETVAPLNETGVEAYSAKAGDKIGPFKIAFNLEIRIADAREPSLLKAAIKGGDSAGLNRISGSLHIMLSPASPATQMRFEADIEILGKLATLGAVPIRRRATEKFAEFARNIQAQFASAEPANPPAHSANNLRASRRTQSAKDRR